MHVYIDHKLVSNISTYSPESQHTMLLEACRQAGLVSTKASLEAVGPQVVLSWPTLLEYIAAGELFEAIPPFDQQSPLFALLIASLGADGPSDAIVRLFDQIFVECLTQIKALPHIQQAFLIEHIRQKQRSGTSSPAQDLFDFSLANFEKALKADPYKILHDLTLYLAWERVCVNLAKIFEHSFEGSPLLKISQSGLEALKACLLESFQHIAAQGKTVPGFFRLIEAIYAFEMRPENIDYHSDAAWALLCQSSRALKPRDRLAAACYIDAVIIDEHKPSKMCTCHFLTLDSPEQVRASLALTRYMLEKFKNEIPGWRYALGRAEIVCFKGGADGLSVDTTLQT